MITLTFGQRADMRSNTYISPTIDSQIGNVTSILSHNRTSVTASTAKSGTVVFTGKIKFGSQNSLSDSDVTGISLFDHNKHMLLSISGVTKLSFNDLGREEAPQKMVSLLLRGAGQGISIHGSGFGDVLVGLSGNDQLFGNRGDDVLHGRAGNDNLNGGAGADHLDGGVGRDVMTGGAGNDTYIVDAAADQVIESVNGGTDSVQSSASWIMGAQVENLTLIGKFAINGTGNASANHLFGNVAANILSGGDGNDRLDGGQGADRLAGGRGNDLFIVDNSRDVVVELAGQGTDTVHSSISYRLPSNVERLTLLGSGDINGTGNNLANVLRGNDGDNVLSGGGGHDVLLPGHGHDQLSGGAGADDFVVTGGSGDTLVITDLFESGFDHLWLQASAVAGVGPGALSTDNFRASTAAPDGNDFIVYDQTSGVLSYDASGNSGTLFTLASLTAGTLFTLASLTAGTILLADDISIGQPLV